MYFPFFKTSPVYELWSTFARTCTTSPALSDSGRRRRGLPRRSRVVSGGPAQPPSATRISLVTTKRPCCEHSARAFRRPPDPERMENAMAACLLAGVKKNLPLYGTGSLSSLISIERMKWLGSIGWLTETRSGTALGSSDRVGESIAGRCSRSRTGCAYSRRGARSTKGAPKSNVRRETFITSSPMARRPSTEHTIGGERPRRAYFPSPPVFVLFV